MAHICLPLANVGLFAGGPYLARGPDNQETTMRVPHSSWCCLSGSFLLRSLDEPPCDRIAVDVFQLLCAFGATPDIEIVIPWLPEVFATSDEAPRDGLFQGFQSLCENGAAAPRLDDFSHFTAGLRPRLTQISPLRGCFCRNIKCDLPPRFRKLCSHTDSFRAVARVARSGSVTSR